MGKIKRKKVCRIFCVILIVFLAFIGYRLAARSRIWERQCQGAEEGDCEIYYLLNIDGMKGLGHSALLLVDEGGEGRIFSYNGMQYNLFQCLIGKEGIGKMKEFFLDKELLEKLMETGDLPAGEYEECSNFDRALGRKISREQYEQVIQAANRYIAAEEQYERLYAQWNRCSGEEAEKIRCQIDDFLSSEDTPLYQIYIHNCDTAARELIGRIDGEVNSYNRSEARLTPNGNYKHMCEELGEIWGFRRLGKDTRMEKILDFLI